MGQVVLFHNGHGQMVCHRLIKITADNYFITQGDVVGQPDEKWPASSLLGTVTGVERGGRFYNLEQGFYARTATFILWPVGRWGLIGMFKLWSLWGRLFLGRKV